MNLKKKIQVKKERVNLVINDVVLIVPTDSKSKIKEFKELKNNEIGKIAIGEPKSVPVGQYTMEILKNLGISDVTSKAVYAKDAILKLIAEIGVPLRKTGKNMLKNSRSYPILFQHIHSPTAFKSHLG